MKKLLLTLLPVAAAFALVLSLGAGAATAQSSGASSYSATLAALNHATGSGTLTLALNGDQATITEHVSGLAATFMNGPFPHVQHIHINGQGTCPTASADKNGDGIVDTVEGQPSYGEIGTTLSTSGDTSPAAGTNVKIAPSGASFDYSRTITLDPATLAALKAGKAVIVVHGLDPATLSQQAQGEKSNLVPALPLAATSPALCGTLTAAAAPQMNAVPQGGAATGGGSTSGLQHDGLFVLGGLLLAGAVLVLIVRERTAEQR